MQLLTFTTLYPNTAQPAYSLFVEHRLQHVVKAGGIDARVIAPVPWFPLRGRRFGRYGTYASVPGGEVRQGIEVLHPRFVSIPKIGMNVAPLSMTLATRGVVSRLANGDKPFELIDAHYFYPDAIAAAAHARRHRCPLVITARGSDINLIANYAVPRRMMIRAASQAAAIIAVSDALRVRLIEMGVPAGKISVIRNGVDREVFGGAAREPAGIPSDTAVGAGEKPCRHLISVGNLVELKGHDLVIRALSRIPDSRLTIAGDGPLRKTLQQLAERTGCGDRVRFTGAIGQKELAGYYAAADVLVLASSREGLPNVVLESLACGTPVVATDVGGSGELLTGPAAGVLVRERSVEGIVDGIRKLFRNYPDRSAVRGIAAQYDWQNTASQVRDLFYRVIADYPAGTSGTD